MSRISPAAFALFFVAALATIPAEAAQRAFVSSTGSDANTASGCGVGAPCRSFASAMTVVNAGGEIVALDAAGYGPVTIDKSVTITANPGFYAGIAAATGNAVTIATGGVGVVLRGLNITSTGGDNGVDMTNGTSLLIENCAISYFLGGGVNVTTAATVRIVDSLIRQNYVGVLLDNGATATIAGTKLLDNGYEGLSVGGAMANMVTTAAISDTIVSGSYRGIYTSAIDYTATARASVTRSTLSNNYYGAIADIGNGTQVVTLSSNMVTGNTIGLSQAGTTSALRSLGNNTVDQNGSDTSGTITTVSGI
jgi:hypothetical protein